MAVRLRKDAPDPDKWQGCQDKAKEGKENEAWLGWSEAGPNPAHPNHDHADHLQEGLHH